MLSSLKKFKSHLSVTISGDSIQSSITREHIKQRKEKYNLGNNHYFSSTGEYVKCFFFFFLVAVDDLAVEVEKLWRR